MWRANWRQSVNNGTCIAAGAFFPPFYWELWEGGDGGVGGEGRESRSVRTLQHRSTGGRQRGRSVYLKGWISESHGAVIPR